MLKKPKKQIMVIVFLLIAVSMSLIIYGCGKDGEPSFAVIHGATQ